MKNFSFKTISYALTAFAVASTQALTADDEADLYGDDVAEVSSTWDPFEPVNRVTFQFNDFLLSNAIKPIVDGYQWVTPQSVQEGAQNFFRNIRYPIRLGGNLLQGRLGGAWTETGRFAINSTVGVLGVFTPADDIEGLEPIPAEDLAQALGAWGIGEGPYIVLPFVGPSNLRDTVGSIGDTAMNPLREPFSLVDSLNPEWEATLAVSELVVTSPSVVSAYERAKASSIDPYSTIKNAYSQLTRAKLKD
ncbi:MAG: VacJ family lipoprotein [Lentimonas sp.]